VHELVSPELEAIIQYVPGKPIEELERELGIAPGQTVKLASNENPHGPSPRALEAMTRAVQSAHRYPDGSAWALSDALARHHGVSREEIVVGSGSNELINLMVLTFVRRGEEVLLATPSFVCYELACRATGAAFRTIPLRDVQFDLEALVAAVTPATKLIFLDNPNNPTGTYVTKPVFERFLGRLPPNVLLVMDEAYFEYVDAPDYAQSLAHRADRPRLVTLRTFSKIHGLAGLRVGYAIAQRDIAQYLHRVRAPFNVSSIAQAGALAALQDRSHVVRSQQHNRSERARVTKGLTDLGCRVAPSQANFVLVEVPGRAAAAAAGEVYQRLLRKGVIVRSVENYGLPRHLRITIGTIAENDRLLTAMAEVLE
jgi:histidinol-phosphate aminotransferase